MKIYEAIKTRHSVRSFSSTKICSAVLADLTEEIAACNKESSLHFQLIMNDPGTFEGLMSRIGKFKGVNNYIALVGKNSTNLNQLAGYYGERIVLKAQQLGLNTCWVSTSYNKRKCAAEIDADEKLVCVIAIGYGTTQGNPHKSKPMESLYQTDVTPPNWFLKGMEAVILAPSASNRQEFVFTLANNFVSVEAKNGLDLGIVKYHFEIGAGKDNFSWA